MLLSWPDEGSRLTRAAEQSADRIGAALALELHTGCGAGSSGGAGPGGSLGSASGTAEASTSAEALMGPTLASTMPRPISRENRLASSSDRGGPASVRSTAEAFVESLTSVAEEVAAAPEDTDGRAERANVAFAAAGVRWLQDTLPFCTLLLVVFLQQHILALLALGFFTFVLQRANASLKLAQVTAAPSGRTRCPTTPHAWTPLAHAAGAAG
eukprot:scaffold24105_cov113-Isochrysis_galbana.AAC.1